MSDIAVFSEIAGDEAAYFAAGGAGTLARLLLTAEPTQQWLHPLTVDWYVARLPRCIDAHTGDAAE